MLEEVRSIKSGRKELRQFSIALGVILGILGSLFFFQEKNYYFYFFIFSLIFLVLGAIVPMTVKPIQKVWMSLTIIIGWVVTGLILSILFYLIVTPIGIIAKIFGKRFLDTRFKEERQSYWIAREPVKFDKRNYERQF